MSYHLSMSALSELVAPIEYAVVLTLDDPVTGEQIQELCNINNEGKIQANAYRSAGWQTISTEPLSLIQGFSFGTNHVDLEHPATREEFRQLGTLLANNTFNQSMLYQIITAEDETHESIKHRPLGELIASLEVIHIELELLAEQYGEEDVAHIINSGLPSLHLISEILASNIDIELARYVN